MYPGLVWPDKVTGDYLKLDGYPGTDDGRHQQAKHKVFIFGVQYVTLRAQYVTLRAVPVMASRSPATLNNRKGRSGL